MKKSRPPMAGPTRKHLARAQREAVLRRWVIAATGAIVALTAGTVGYGLVDQTILKPRRPVARVGSTDITVADFEKAAKYQRVQLINQYGQYVQIMQIFGSDESTAAFYQSQLNQLQSQLSDPLTLGRRALNSMIDDEIIRQEASRLGITVSAEEVDQAIREAFGYHPGGTPTPEPTATPAATPTPQPDVTAPPTAIPAPTLTPTPGPSPTPFPTATPYTAEAFQEDYADFVARTTAQTGMSEADIRRLFEADLLRDKVRDAVVSAAPREVVEAHARHILVADEAAARDIIRQLQGGADFVDLAAQHSEDLSNKDQGGDLGTFPPGRMVPEFDQVVFNVGLGLYPEAVKTSFGYHVVEVLARQPRALTESELEQAKRDEFDRWLNDRRLSPDLVTEFDLWQLVVPTRPTLEDVLNPERAPAR